uniref:TPM domain-containing protein n=1 Tax=Heterorhabditis bacteriophora TaxID=37862 RepID=A0A1I7XLE6_HETBA
MLHASPSNSDTTRVDSPIVGYEASTRHMDDAFDHHIPIHAVGPSRPHIQPSKNVRMTMISRDEESVLFAAMKFANTVRRRQYRGQCEDDLLIFLSTKDKVVWTSVGKVTQRYLSTQMINSITISSETHFRNGEYTEGLQYMVDSYTSILNGEHLEVISNAVSKRARNPYSWMETKRARNPYSWMTEQGKRARNPYSWLAKEKGTKRSPRFAEDVLRQPRNPYSWMYSIFEKRTRNPYSWMNE